MPRAGSTDAIDLSLLNAATNGQLDLVQSFIDEGARANTRSRDSKTPLMLASEFGHFEVVQFLLPLADPSLQDKEGWTALMRAARNKSHSTVALFLVDHERSGVLTRNKGGINALMMSCLSGFDDCTALLLPYGGADATTLRGLNAFMLCVQCNQSRCGELVLPATDLTWRESSGLDAVEFAYFKGNSRLAQLARAESVRRELLSIEQVTKQARPALTLAPRL